LLLPADNIERRQVEQAGDIQTTEKLHANAEHAGRRISLSQPEFEALDACRREAVLGAGGCI
jgi:hypothetical protein